MALQFYNTFNRKTEEFTPIKDGEAEMYTCGPTVYNYAHIGNFRAYVFEDILRRVLKFCGYKVTQVMNLTDVDDKTIRDSQAAGMSLNDFTQTYKDAFFEDLDILNIEPAEHYPAATDHIQDMIDMITILVEKDVAYKGDDGSIYYSISKFDDYGKLAKIDLENQRQGSRVKSDEYGKESVADFALWKAYDESDGDVAWDSPWGKGRPGWHIECSAMSKSILGKHFDLHTGGIDNMFPHHEDEIAQSEAAHDCKFVNYWLHCEHLIVNGEKMAKSAGNFFTLRDLLDKGYTGREIRWLLMASHYRQKLNFTFDGLDSIRTTYRRIDDFMERVNNAASGESKGDDIAKSLADTLIADFKKGVEDDLNMSAALAAFFDFMRAVNKELDSDTISGDAVKSLQDALDQIDTVLGVLNVETEEDEIPAEILQKLDDRQEARKNKDYAAADAIRDELSALGYIIEDSPDGARLKRA